MLFSLILLNWMFSILFIFMNHPLSLGYTLLMQTIIISMSMGYFFMNFWFSYILFLVMIGGMLVMFIYMTSIASNEKFKMPKYSIIFSSLILISIIMVIFSDLFYTGTSNNTFINLSQSFLSMPSLTMNKFMNYPNLQMMLLLMIYLFVTLIATVKIVGKNIGSLRKK